MCCIAIVLERLYKSGFRVRETDRALPESVTSERY